MDSQTVYTILLVGLISGVVLWELSLRFRILKFLIKLFPGR
jgi:hypothetical protein